MGVFTKLGEGIGDLAQLNVRTFTGDITGMLPAAGKKTGNAAANAASYDFDGLLKAALPKGTIKLVAVSRIMIDGDADHLFAPDITPEMKQMHLDAVEAGQEFRLGLLEMARGVFEGLL
jgi:hypothetical protein